MVVQCHKCLKGFSRRAGTFTDKAKERVIESIFRRQKNKNKQEGRGERKLLGSFVFVDGDQILSIIVQRRRRSKFESTPHACHRRGHESVGRGPLTCSILR